MTNFTRKIIGDSHPKGFTLVELIIVLGFFAFLSALLMQNIFSVYKFTDVIKYKKDVNFETSGVLNNAIAGLIRSGFSINYANTESTNSEETGEASEGFINDVDKISIFTDRAETQYFTIYREAYRSEGDNSDTSRLMLSFNNKNIVSDSDIIKNSFPLHSSEIVIEDFNIEIPPNPKLGGDRELQPYVSLYVRARHRYPFGEVIDEKDLEPHQNIKASYKTTYTLRNTVPSSYKR